LALILLKLWQIAKVGRGWEVLAGRVDIRPDLGRYHFPVLTGRTPAEPSGTRRDGAGEDPTTVLAGTSQIPSA